MTKRMILPLVLLLCTTALGADEKEITVKLTVPDAAWTIAIDEAMKSIRSETRFGSLPSFRETRT